MEILLIWYGNTMDIYKNTVDIERKYHGYNMEILLI